MGHLLMVAGGSEQAAGGVRNDASQFHQLLEPVVSLYGGHKPIHLPGQGR